MMDRSGHVIELHQTSVLNQQCVKGLVMLCCVSVQIEVVFVALDQCGSSNDRRIALIDKNRDLYLTSVRTLGRAHSIHKIGKSTVQSGVRIKAWFI